MRSLQELVAAQIESNRRWSIGLLGAAALNCTLILLLAVAIAGWGGALVATASIAAWVAGAYLFYTRSILDRVQARRPTNEESQRLMPFVTRLSGEFALPPPNILILDENAPNAFAMGQTPSTAIIAFTTGLLRMLPDRELEGVAAHELAHIANHDTRLCMWSAVLLGWAVVLSAAGSILAVAGIGMGKGFGAVKGDAGEKLLFVLVGFGIIVAAAFIWLCWQLWLLIARLADLAVYRQREWLADASAVQVTQDPLALASALERMRDLATLTRGQRLVQKLCIVGAPPTGNWWDDLFLTHPSLQRRIDRLRELARPPGANLPVKE